MKTMDPSGSFSNVSVTLKPPITVPDTFTGVPLTGSLSTPGLFWLNSPDPPIARSATLPPLCIRRTVPRRASTYTVNGPALAAPGTFGASAAGV